MVTTTSSNDTAGAWPGVTSQRIVLIAKPGGPQTGVGRYVQALHEHLREAGVEATRLAPALPPLPDAGYSGLRRLGVDLRAFLTNYPVWASYPPADIYHLTSQNLASLLLFRRPSGRVVVTVHDIIPYVLRHNPQLSSYRTAADRLFDQLAMAGLKRADALIADSAYTKQCVVEQLGIAAEKIAVVHLGIDHGRFHPLDVPADTWERYRLPRSQCYLIYVGSEDPRKNLETLVRALAEVRAQLPDVALIKVGRAHNDSERDRLVELATALGVRSAIYFLDDVPEADLPLLYNLADICVMPSLYEGFGFPVLEAMACGTPVVCARATSLPEIAGGATVLFEHENGAVQSLAASLLRILPDDDLCGQLSELGQIQATTFHWQRTSQQVLGVYQQ
jgi:glycosyltransferase involved in cell wall biosynthesis